MKRKGARRALGWAAVALVLSLGLARLHDYRGWDQNFYLAQTSSLAEDGDVDLRNDLLHLHREPTTLLRALTNLEPTGALSNTFAIGAPLLWLPPYVLAMPLRTLAEAPAARWPRAQLAALHLFALALMVWLLWAFDRWLRRMGVTRWLAVPGALALVLGTPLVVYGFRAYMGSHQASAVAVMLLLLATLRLGDRGTPTAAWLWGIALGLVFLCRWQDLVKGAVVLVPVLQLHGRGGVRPGRWAGLAAAAGAGALITAGVQLHAWLLERGAIFSLPQGPSYIDLAGPEIGRFLFSGLAGLLPWSPVFAIGFVGLLLPWRCRLPVAWRWVALAVLLFDVYLNATVDDWWGGVAYGARRMSSDVPLLAVGLANLASWRRLRLPLVAALVACCVWGGVTANLRVHGLRDLAILWSGEASSAPGAEREGGAQPTHAEAVEVATSWPLGRARMSYFAGNWRPGRPLTVALGALACLLAGWLLGRPRAPDRLGAALLAVLVLAAFAHARLLTADRVDPADRELWARLGSVADGRAAVGPTGVAAVDVGDDRFTEARRFLLAAALWRQGERGQAQAQVAGLEAYPFREPMLKALAMAPGERELIARQGLFHRVRERRPSRSLTLARQIDLACKALRLTVVVETPAAVEPSGRLLSLGRRGEPPLAAIEVAAAGRVGLRTSAGFEESFLTWRPKTRYELELEWMPRPGRVSLTAAGPDGAGARLAAPAEAATGGTGRLEVVIGPPRVSPGSGPMRGARFFDLQLTARNACSGP